MGPYFRRFLALTTSLTVLFFLSLLAGCGGTSKSSANNGSSGSNNSGSGGTGSSNTGSGGSNSGGSGSGGSGSSGSVAYAYTANGTSVMAYAVNADGSLSTVSGSPYAIPIQVQQTVGGGALVTNGANLYAVSKDSHNLVIAPINKSSGSLSQPTTSSISAGDPNTSDMGDFLTLDSSGSYLYAVVGFSDQDSGTNVFNVNSSTNVKPVQFLPGSAIAGSPLVFTSDDHYAYNFDCSARVTGVNGYARASNGTLTHLAALQAQPAVTSAGTGYCPAGLAASANGYLAIAWIPFAYASTVPVGNQISVGLYKINGDGSITLVSNSGVNTPINTMVALSFDPNGNFLAVAGNGGLQIYSVSSSGTLTAVGSAQDSSVSFADVTWDKSNHVFATSGSQLYVFSSNNGTLTPASGSPYGGGAGLTVLPLK